MPLEIERRFFVKDLSPIAKLQPDIIRQAYVVSGSVSVRVRLLTPYAGAQRAFLTLKTTEPGMSRHEFEYEIDPESALEMSSLSTTLGVLDKHRYVVPYRGKTFEVDVFSGPLSGLVLAEVELASEGERVELPAWLGDEITHRRDYSNESLARYGLPRDFAPSNSVKPSGRT